MLVNNVRYRIFIFSVMVIFFQYSGFNGRVSAQVPESLHLEESNQYQALKDSVADSLKTESANLDQLRQKLDNITQLKPVLEGEINAYKTQHTTYVNILLLSKTDIKELEKAVFGCQTSIVNIDDRLNKLQSESDIIKQDQARLDEQYQNNKAQLEEIRSNRSRITDAAFLMDQLRSLIKVFDKKKEITTKLQEFYSTRILSYTETQIRFKKLNEKLEMHIKDKKRQALLERKEDLFSITIVEKALDDFRLMKKQILFMASKSFWIEETRTVWKTGGPFVLLFFLLFGLSQILFVRFRRYSKNLEKQPAYEQRPMLRLTLLVIKRSLSLLGIAVFLFGYTLLRPVSSFISLILSIVQTLLFTRWGLDFIRLLPEVRLIRIPHQQEYMLRFLIHSMRYYVLAYVVIAYILNADSALLFIGRIFFEIGFVVWAVLFGKLIKRKTDNTEDSEVKPRHGNFLSACCYIIVIGALFFEIAGYGSLANYWYLSWGKSSVVMLWGYILFFFVKEWDKAHRVELHDDATDQEKVEAPIRWLIVKVIQMAFVGLFIISLIIAWGGRQAFLLNFFKVLNYTLTVGNMKINLLGCIYFILILFITHTVARLWKYFFQQKLLARSGMEIGLQDSITTITVYLIWVIGVLISLHAIGLNTTSITVALGALGIGLGFGLQNIFNNFLSGIILLFERPIQVGDDLEMNGIWGTVKKINVRSTVVQTYDNASLIIPNSDLISSQVTNWSFKDKRLRRQITVGVAYGSDTELVRKSLLEAVENRGGVLKYPKPDVIFTDFGDNALIFKLRFWTHIAAFLTVETDVRFEIDRIFRERNITIAFPQRDVHIFYENSDQPK